MNKFYPILLIGLLCISSQCISQQSLSTHFLSKFSSSISELPKLGDIQDHDISRSVSPANAQLSSLSSLAISCDDILYENFESGSGIWNEGPSSPNLDNHSECARGSCYGFDSSDGNIYSNPLDFSGYTSAEISFVYTSTSLENGEGFSLEVSTNGGSYNKIEEWIIGQDYSNGQQMSATVVIASQYLSSNTVIKFQSLASHNGEETFIDNIEIKGCSPANCNIGNPCNDGDSCTINDVYDVNCNCVGTFQDSDADGVCNANDVCPEGDDTIDNDGNGVPDFCDSDECDADIVEMTIIEGDLKLDGSCFSVIMQSENGSCFRVTVLNNGEISSTPIDCD